MTPNSSHWFPSAFSGNEFGKAEYDSPYAASATSNDFLHSDGLSYFLNDFTYLERSTHDFNYASGINRPDATQSGPSCPDQLGYARKPRLHNETPATVGAHHRHHLNGFNHIPLCDPRIDGPHRPTEFEFDNSFSAHHGPIAVPPEGHSRSYDFDLNQYHQNIEGTPPPHPPRTSHPMTYSLPHSTSAPPYQSSDTTCGYTSAGGSVSSPLQQSWPSRDQSSPPTPARNEFIHMNESFLSTDHSLAAPFALEPTNAGPDTGGSFAGYPYREGHHWPQTFKITQVKQIGPKKQTLACFFCRSRKIACNPPAVLDEAGGSVGRTCEQCEKRKIECKYPKESRRGQHNRIRNNSQKEVD
ncbi:hypothetical protein C8J57DRAFT_1523200 [Mycena rebaudengoi]|nr:hypothetical protein C8J57DRAFT_1523200 [Mycena rebaudengoi]